MIIPDILSEAFDMLFPRVCTVCHTPLVRSEDVMCVSCLADLPLTRVHLRQPNEIHTRLASVRSHPERCAALFSYRSGNPYSRLILAAKYGRRPSVGRKLAAWYATELQRVGFFEGIDLILPMPLYLNRFIRRGYNQSEHIARGLSEVTGIPLGDHLRTRGWIHRSQTRQSAAGRRSNVSYRVIHPEELAGRHVLVVDDVITTGSTMVAALDALQSTEPSLTVSVLALGLTANN